MPQARKVLMIALVVAGFSLFGTGCKSDEDAAPAMSANPDHPTQEHPTADHPTGEHPK